MKAKDKLKTYYVQGFLRLLVGIEISARSLTEATEKANQLKEEDFVDILGEYQDGNMRVTGVYEGDPNVDA